MTTIYIPREQDPDELRAAATPETVKRFVKEGLAVRVQVGLGEQAHFADADYAAAGAEVVPSFNGADVVLRVTPPTAEEAATLEPGSLLVAFLAPHQHLDVVRALRDRRVSSIAMELIPRITRAQTMDALSSQASLGGYKAVLIAASRLDKYFPLLMTAAGTIKPARVVVMGAGVAGLQAIATAKRLGAVVEVSDIREAVKEQVESLGGRFIELPMEEAGEGEGGYAREMGEDFLRRQREIVARHVAAADVVITTAQIPGRKAPVLVTEEMVDGMRAGAVIVDLAVASGGNCELSRPDEEVVRNGVRILGFSNLPASVPRDATTLYARNLQALLLELLDEGTIIVDPEGEISGASLVTHNGTVVHGPTAASIEGGG